MPPMIITEDHTRLMPERAKRELIRGENARAEFAIFAQNQLQEALRAERPVHHVDGLGRKIMSITPELAARIRVKQGNWACLHDPDFLRALARDNPFLRVNCTARALTLRVDGLRDSRRSETREHEGAAPVMSRSRRECAGATGDPALPAAAVRDAAVSSQKRPSGHASEGAASLVLSAAATRGDEQL